MPLTSSDSEGVSPGGDVGWERARGPSLVRALWRYRWVILATACICGAAGFVYASLQPTVYEAVSGVKLLNPYDRTIFRGERAAPFTDVDRYLNTQADLVKSPEVMTRASEILGNSMSPREIRQHVDAESSTELFEVTVRAHSGDPVEATDLANAVAQAYQDVATARSAANVEASVAQLNSLQESLREKLNALPDPRTDPSVEEERVNLSGQLVELEATAGKIQADAAVYGSGIDRIAQAGEAQSISDTPRRMAVIFGLLGFIIALVAAFWRSERVRVIDGSDDAAATIDAPLLGVLPRHPADTAAAAAPVLTAPDSGAARQHQFIASNLTLIASEIGTRVLLVTSPEPNEATSLTALNLALSITADQRTVILVDLDDSAAMTRLLGADTDYGVSDYFGGSSQGGIAVEDHAAPIERLIPDYAGTKWRRDGRGASPSELLDRIDGFRVVPAGTDPTSRRSAAASPRMAKLLAQLQQEADFIVLDGPPLLQNAAGVKLAAIVDGVVLVVRRGTAVDKLRQTRVLVSRAQASVLGYVFDQSRLPSPWRGESMSRLRGNMTKLRQYTSKRPLRRNRPAP